MMSITREKLIEVARQLFARTGVENTTMNDIAQASQRGRRTLYTYFTSKKEIYHAVIETEISHLYDTLQKVVASAIPPDQKLLQFIKVRLNAIKELVFRNGTLKANFFRDIWKVENVRKNFDLKEIELIKQIIGEGVHIGMFDIKNINSVASVLHYAFKGLEVPYIRGKMESRLDDAVELILNGVMKKGNS